MMTDPTEEHVAAYAAAAPGAVAAGESTIVAGLRAVLELVQRDEIEPLEEQLAASERDVAGLGRRLHDVLHDDKLPDADERARQRGQGK